MPARLGCVLSGGGVPGIAGHLGLLHCLEEQGIRPDIVVGTSAGGAVAGLLASGLTVQNQIDFFLRQSPLRLLPGEFMHVFDLLLHRHHNTVPGILSTYFLWSEAIPTRKLVRDWPPVYGVVASDLTAFAPAYITSATFGDMSAVDALQATTAFPFLFSGVLYGGHILVDGGMYDNIPVAFARRLGATHALVVKIVHDLPEAPGLSLDGLAHRMLRAWMEFAERALNSDGYPTFTLEIPVRGGLVSFQDFHADLEAGRRAAQSLELASWLRDHAR